MFKTRKGLLAIILLSLFWSGGWHLKDIFGGFGQSIRVSEKAEQHILRGDERGGGHRFGAGKPCKSEFPANWSGDEIIKRVKQIAANDNIDWRRQQNGYYVGQQDIDGVVVRVVLNKQRDDVVTAYPLNVKRNPCPRDAANDNRQDSE